MAGSYRVLRNEPNMGIGPWTGHLVANETLTVGVRHFSEDTAAVLLEAGLIEPSDADPPSDPPAPKVESAFLARAVTQSDEELADFEPEPTP